MAKALIAVRNECEAGCRGMRTAGRLGGSVQRELHGAEIEMEAAGEGVDSENAIAAGGPGRQR